MLRCSRCDGFIPAAGLDCPNCSKFVPSRRAWGSVLKLFASAMAATTLVGCLEAHQCTLVDGGSGIVDTGTQCAKLPPPDAGGTDGGTCDGGGADGGC